MSTLEYVYIIQHIQWKRPPDTKVHSLVLIVFASQREIFLSLSLSLSSLFKIFLFYYSHLSLFNSINYFLLFQELFLLNQIFLIIS